MEINIRTLLPFLLFYLLKESSAQTVHNVFTYTSSLMEELECIFTSTGTVLWTEQRDDGSAINLFVYDVTNGLVQKQTDDSKFDNFNYSIEVTDRFNLVIKNVEQGDGGRYQCNPITTDAVTFVVTVEVLPESININCTESNVCMPSAGKKTASEMITCNCTAYGLSSSQLEIQWDAVGINSISNTRFGSSSISSNITLQPPSETFSVSCSLTGYKSQIPESLIRDSITFSPPVCILTSVCPSNGTNASLTCSCSKGSPVVYGYSFYNSQKLLIKTQSISTLQVNSDKVETFYCKGCTGVFNSQSEPLELNCNGAYVAEKDKAEDTTSADKLLENGSAFPWWIFIVICILLLFAAIFLFKKGRKKPAIHQDEEIVQVKKEGGHGQAERMNLLNENGDNQKVQEVKGSGPDNKSTSAGSGGVGPGEVTGRQNDAAREKIEKKEPPVEPKTKVENNQSADNSTRTNRGESTEQAAPPSHARTGGDGKSDSDTQEGNEKNDSSSQTNSDQEPSKHLLPGVESNVDPENYNGNEAHQKNDKLGGDEPTVDPENHGKEADGKNDMMNNDSNTPTVTDANSQQKDVLIASAPAFL